VGGRRLIHRGGAKLPADVSAAGFEHGRSWLGEISDAVQRVLSFRMPLLRQAADERQSGFPGAKNCLFIVCEVWD